MIGQKLGHNRVVGKIGEGGMGAVYRGVDEHLHRDVAIKILPAHSLNDDSARRRFRKEAHALSRLNHPNIEAVFDFDADSGVDYLVIEYVEGLTLRELLERGPLPEKEILRLGMQVAEGLSAAHECAIVHCDLKPSNVMVTPDGRVKILDFGLALLARPEADDGSTDSSNRAGSGGGTVPYMAPEQLSGESVDNRTDIYALGNLLYEMATGRRPFHGTVPTAVADDILHKPPPLPCRLRPELSPRLEEILLKCLEKDPDRRYQSTKEIVVDLRRLSDPSSHPSGGNTAPERGRPWRTAGYLVAAVAGATLLGVALWRWNHSADVLPTYEPRRITTAPGWHTDPAVSSDGNYLAYTANDHGSLDIFVTHQREGREERITTNPASDSEPAWFPDNSIAFTSDRLGKPGIWRVSLLSKIETLMVENASHPAVSPDGTMLAFVKAEPGGKFELSVGPVADLSAAILLETGTGGEWQSLWPAWAPDGRRLCFAARHNLWTIAAAGGKPVPLTVDGESDYEPAWSPGGRHVYFSSHRGGGSAIWRVNARGGTPQRVTSGAMKEIHPALSRDGLSLLFSSDAIHERLVLHERKAGRDPSIVIDDSKMGAISPDKTRIALIRDMIQPDIVLWLQLLSGGRLNGAPYALDHGPGSASMPAFSPDGQWISFSVLHQKQSDIWIVPSGGGPRTRLTNDPAFDSHASWSPDGGSIAFTSARSGRDRLWISRVEAGAPIGLPRMVRGVELDAFFPTWAPDGSRIAFLGRIDGRFDVWIVPTDGTIPARQVTHSGDLKYLRWTRSGGLLVSGWWGSRKVALRLLNPETGESQPYLPAVEFGNDYPAQFDITPDETVVLVARKDREGNIWQLMAAKNQF